MILLMTFPAGPMTSATFSGFIKSVMMRGAKDEISGLGAGRASSFFSGLPAGRPCLEQSFPEDFRADRGDLQVQLDGSDPFFSSCDLQVHVPKMIAGLSDERKNLQRILAKDHYDLITLENPDFYADGRDLGENYTYTSWLMSPCLKSGKLHCVTCHTSSGRYRFKDLLKQRLFHRQVIFTMKAVKSLSQEHGFSILQV
jgi:hypothetical protein